MASESPDAPMKTKVCPIISDSRGSVLCKGDICYAAYYRSLMGETICFCLIIDGTGDS